MERMTICKRATKRDFGVNPVTLDHLEIHWEGTCLIIRQSDVPEATSNPTHHDYEITITLAARG